MKDIDALFGKAKYMETRRNFSSALDLISQAVVAYPNFLPALIEKMKVQLALQDWEQTIETAQRFVVFNLFVILSFHPTADVVLSLFNECFELILMSCW